MTAGQVGKHAERKDMKMFNRGVGAKVNDAPPAGGATPHGKSKIGVAAPAEPGRTGNMSGSKTRKDTVDWTKGGYEGPVR
jgi:hypothetical protein